MAYGYLWWIPTEAKRGPRWRGAFAALGNYGQNILGLPEIDTVIVSRRAVTDQFAIARNLGKTDAAPAGGSISGAAFFGAAEKIAAAAV
jgi:CubicO group peptidase (beta-lactamase class C family)